MDKITLRNGNVVKEVESEDRAKALEAKGFVRDGAVPVTEAGDTKALEKELKKTKEDLVRASEYMEASDKHKGELEKELADTKAELETVKGQLEEEKKNTATLAQELEGTKEQLKAAVKKNTAAKK